MALKTDYKNYIPDANGRVYEITQNAQGKSIITDVTNYVQVGDNVGANDINAITTELNNASDAITTIKSGVAVITIPIDNWVTETDTDGNNYYTREIDVAGMTAEYIGGNSKIDYVRPNPFSINANETALEMYQLILDVESMAGKIKVIASEIPTTAFQIYLYGV